MYTAAAVFAGALTGGAVLAEKYIRAIRPVSLAVGTKRDPRKAWFWWLGEPLPPLATPPALYARRFGIEHGYKFDKQSLLWGRLRVRAPAQFERWTDLVAAAHHHLALARPLVAVTHRPWERAARTPTPAQVRRALPRVLAFTQSR